MKLLAMETFRKIIRLPHGILLVTGPTGSGKTTTLYAALSKMDASVQKIITVEDPVEYRLPGLTQVQVNDKIDYWKTLINAKEIIPVSAKKSLHLDELLSETRKYLPEQLAMYGEDELTDKTERFLAAELIREKIFRLLGDEVPYSVTVEIEKFENLE